MHTIYLYYRYINEVILLLQTLLKILGLVAKRGKYQNRP
jgi:hypothetical protein